MFRLPIVLAVCTLSGLSLAQEATPTDPPGARSTSGAIDAGLLWLVRHQEENGGWSASQFQRHDPKDDLCTGTGKPDQDLHVTAWATLALLSRGNTERLGFNFRPVQKALAWLQAQQQKDGLLGASEPANAVEAHALACFVLAEGKTLSDKPLPEEALKKLVAMRLPDGTWPARVGGKQGEPMATYWAGMACKTGALKLDLDPTLTAIAENKLTSAPLPSAEAMLRWMAAHYPAKDARLADALEKLAEQPPQWREGAEAVRMDFLDWHLGTYALFQDGGTGWQQWYPALLAALVPHQRTDGAHAGSWDPVDARGAQGGRVYATAVNVLSLSAGQRFGRIVKERGAGAKK